MKNLYSEAERISKKDKSNLYVVSNFFDDAEKYNAFVSFYAVMRVIDDRVDSMSAKGGRFGEEANKFLDEWEVKIAQAYAGLAIDDPLSKSLSTSLKKFPLPKTVYSNFIRSMRHDTTADRFSTFDQYLEYAEGATVSPTAGFVYLLASRKQIDGAYLVKDFDYYTYARGIGTFAYLVHILRDLKQDLDLNLVYVPLDIMQKYKFDVKDLALFNKDDSVSEGFKEFVADYVKRARDFHALGEKMAKKVFSQMGIDCHFMLKLIVRMYKELLDKIESVDGQLFSNRHKLTFKEKARIALKVADEVGYPKDKVLKVFAKLSLS